MTPNQTLTASMPLQLVRVTGIATTRGGTVILEPLAPDAVPRSVAIQDGRFTIRNLMAGRYRVRFADERGLPRLREITLAGGGLVRL